ncbi:MAG: HDOD domain-containing protein [Methylophilaceae bacterium]|nr:HDOD domain-containing protein [Methylophilaceae bacterium]
MDLKRIWQHSLVAASIARELAKEVGFDQDGAYIAGLMHTIGQLPINMVFPKAGADIEAVCKGRSVLERHEMEHDMLGIDNNVIGEKLAKHWNFPE